MTEKQEKQILRVFVGISLINDKKASYALTFQNASDSKSITLSPAMVEKASGCELNFDYVAMKALEQIVDIVSASKEPSESVAVNVYSGSGPLSYVWEEEYRNEGKLSSDKASYRDIWQYLIETTAQNKIDLHIYGETSMFNGISRSGKPRRALRQ